MRRKVGTVMRISTFWFCMKQGLVNICRNIWFSLASTAIISACIFLFCVFFSVITNIEIYGPHSGDHNGNHGIF